jgi:hypothetical protein
MIRDTSVECVHIQYDPWPAPRALLHHKCLQCRGMLAQVHEICMLYYLRLITTMHHEH